MKTKSNPNTRHARFELGQVHSTPGAQDTLEQYHVNPFQLLGRHVSGDWGDVCVEDAQSNEEALQVGARIFSVYILLPPADAGVQCSAKVWVITEADRSVTTLLLPEEY